MRAPQEYPEVAYAPLDLAVVNASLKSWQYALPLVPGGGKKSCVRATPLPSSTIMLCMITHVVITSHNFLVLQVLAGY